MLHIHNNDRHIVEFKPLTGQGVRASLVVGQQNIEKANPDEGCGADFD